MKKAKTIFLFDNGMVATCDINGEQIGELQGKISKELYRKLKENSDENTEWKGFENYI